MAASERHRALYKKGSPSWRDTFRQRCVDRLRDSRAQLLERYRRRSGRGASSIVQEVMQEEWSSLTGAALPAEAVLSGMELDELTVLDQVHQELTSQEMSILEEYERNLQFEQQYITSVVDGMDDTHIICPVCHTNNLTINSYFISCLCGLYINTKRQNITPDVLQQLLESRVSDHLENCLHNPVFSVNPNPDSSANLLISCKVCDYLSVVL